LFAGRHLHGVGPLAPRVDRARAADLVFDPTLACCGDRRAGGGGGRTPGQPTRYPTTQRHPQSRLAPSPPEADNRPLDGQGLLLSRTMLSNHGLPYVGRFACDWHRLATTDPHEAHVAVYESPAAGAR